MRLEGRTWSATLMLSGRLALSPSWGMTSACGELGTGYRKLAARFFGRGETWIKRVQSGEYAAKDLHERILEALIRWSALEEIANGKPGGAEQIKRDTASTFERELRPDPLRR
jgi:hypothetical protein